MVTNRPVVVVDSSALISLMNVADQLHEQAIAINEVLVRQDWRVLVPCDVFSETLNAVGKKIGRPEAIEIGQVLIEQHLAGAFEFVHAEPSWYASALTIQKRGAGNPSFIDCLVMALATVHGAQHIFGFDATFRKNGYELPDDWGEPTPEAAARLNRLAEEAIRDSKAGKLRSFGNVDEMMADLKHRENDD